MVVSVASLLNCLHQLGQENRRLEEHINALTARRDHLLAVNARLFLPLSNNPHNPTVPGIHSTVADTKSTTTLSNRSSDAQVTLFFKEYLTLCFKGNCFDNKCFLCVT